jgi:hypothetical protein
MSVHYPSDSDDTHTHTHTHTLHRRRRTRLQRWVRLRTSAVWQTYGTRKRSKSLEPFPNTIIEILIRTKGRKLRECQNRSEIYTATQNVPQCPKRSPGKQRACRSSNMGPQVTCCHWAPTAALMTADWNRFTSLEWYKRNNKEFNRNKVPVPLAEITLEGKWMQKW